MLTIRKFATLAQTTRRTLLFYDEAGIFKPAKLGANGYRYYDYDQLYELTYILELRKLGLSVADIQALQAQTDNQQNLNQQLSQILGKIQTQINDLNVLKQALTNRFSQSMVSPKVQLNQPQISTLQARDYWFSRQSVDCSEEAIAATYTDFYQKMGYLKLIDQHESGFLAELPGANPNLYADAVFSILKQTNSQTNQQLPTLTRPAGRYLTIDTTNDLKAIYVGLQILRRTAEQQHLSLAEQLWQMNLDEQFTSMGGSHYLRLLYQINN